MIADILENEGQAVADSLGDSAIFTRHDVTQEESWKSLMSLTEESFGGLDILVNNAGILEFLGLDMYTVEGMQRTIDINLMGVMIGTQAAIEPMRKRKEVDCQYLIC